MSSQEKSCRKPLMERSEPVGCSSAYANNRHPVNCLRCSSGIADEHPERNPQWVAVRRICTEDPLPLSQRYSPHAGATRNATDPWGLGALAPLLPSRQCKNTLQGKRAPVLLRALLEQSAPLSLALPSATNRIGTQLITTFVFELPFN